MIAGDFADLKSCQLSESKQRVFDMQVKEAQAVSQKYFGKKISFYAPSFVYYRTNYYSSTPTAFPSISITGSTCSLKCKHCGGIVLNTMYPACSPEKLVDLCRELKSKGAVGCLISGGCLPDGSVPLQNFVDAITTIKKELKMTLVVHTGVIRESTARKLKAAGVDAALIDIFGLDETIREVCGLEASVKDYENSLRALHAAEIPTVPHVLVGLQNGRLDGEIRALKIIAKYEPSAVIVIAFTPLHNTVMEDVPPPSPEAIGEVLVKARNLMPSTPIALGCMRPKGEHRVKTDVLAVNAGVNAIAFPAREAIELAEALNYDISFLPYCCSQIFENLNDLCKRKQ